MQLVEKIVFKLVFAALLQFFCSRAAESGCRVFAEVVKVSHKESCPYRCNQSKIEELRFQSATVCTCREKNSNLLK